MSLSLYNLLIFLPSSAIKALVPSAMYPGIPCYKNALLSGILFSLLIYTFLHYNFLQTNFHLNLYNINLAVNSFKLFFIFIILPSTPPTISTISDMLNNSHHNIPFSLLSSIPHPPHPINTSSNCNI